MPFQKTTYRCRVATGPAIPRWTRSATADTVNCPQHSGQSPVFQGCSHWRMPSVTTITSVVVGIASCCSLFLILKFVLSKTINLWIPFSLQKQPCQCVCVCVWDRETDAERKTVWCKSMCLYECFYWSRLSAWCSLVGRVAGGPDCPANTFMCACVHYYVGLFSFPPFFLLFV